jgi:hypothetical protein
LAGLDFQIDRGDAGAAQIFDVQQGLGTKER